MFDLRLLLCINFHKYAYTREMFPVHNKENRYITKLTLKRKSLLGDSAYGIPKNRINVWLDHDVVPKSPRIVPWPGKSTVIEDEDADDEPWKMETSTTATIQITTKFITNTLRVFMKLATSGLFFRTKSNKRIEQYVEKESGTRVSALVKCQLYFGQITVN